MDILERDKAGERIAVTDPEIAAISALIHRAQRILADLNTGYHTNEEVLALLSELTGVAVPECLWLMPPFYSDFGRNIRFGKNVFVNTCCTFMDRGGITLGDRVLVAPKVNLITTGHPVAPSVRRDTVSLPIVVGENVWIGVGASVMPGVTIGRNSIIAAHAVVTRDVPDNVIAGGIPAHVIRPIQPSDREDVAMEIAGKVI